MLHLFSSRRYFPLLLLLAAVLVLALRAAPAVQPWVGTWATSPRPEADLKDEPVLAGATLRQVIHVSLGGGRIRLRLSNAFGATPLTLHGVHVALADAAGGIRPSTDRALSFNGAAAASIPPGACLLSDPLDFNLPALGDLAVSIYIKDVPAVLTMHHGSRTTSYAQPGAALAAPALPAAAKIVHWYFINGLDVVPRAPAAAVVVLGDSFTDGYGCTTDKDNRWTDALVRRLHADPRTAHLAVLNEGIGGNCLLRDGLGPNMLARFDRDVLAQTGANWVIVQAGINDIGTRIAAKKNGGVFASATDLIGAYTQLIERARAQGRRIIGVTLAPFSGADFYWTADGEADRLTLNQWIRTSGRFDAVIDFDAVLRDPAQPARLNPALDSGDHLHPSLAGYVALADAVDPSLFAP